LKKPILLKKIKKKIISQIRDTVLKISNINIIVKKKHKKSKDLDICTSSNALKTDVVSNEKDKTYYDFAPKLNNGLTFFQTLNPNYFPWYMIKIDKMKTKDVYNQYLNLIPDQISFDRLVFKRIEKKNKHKRKFHNRLVNVIKNNTENTQTIQNFVEDNNIYCYCQKKYTPGSKMICKITIFIFRLCK